MKFSIRTIVISILIFTCFKIHAQEAIPVSGGDVSSPSGSISYSIGQVIYNYNFSSSGSIEEGVQHPISNTPVNTEIFTIEPGLQVYPNPFINLFNIEIINDNEGKYSIQVIDVTGNEIYNCSLLSNVTQIELSSIASGLYFLNLKKNGIISKSIEINKI